MSEIRSGARVERVDGRIAEVWTAAERGGSMPSRSVLSGHSVGHSVWERATRGNHAAPRWFAQRISDNISVATEAQR